MTPEDAFSRAIDAAELKQTTSWLRSAHGKMDDALRRTASEFYGVKDHEDEKRRSKDVDDLAVGGVPLFPRETAMRSDRTSRLLLRHFQLTRMNLDRFLSEAEKHDSGGDGKIEFKKLQWILSTMTTLPNGGQLRRSIREGSQFGSSFDYVSFVRMCREKEGGPSSRSSSGYYARRGMVNRIEDRLRELVERRDMSSRSSLSKIFRKFDTNHNGQITETEFRSALEKLGFTATRSEIRELVERFDVDGDGMVSYAEFVNYLLSPRRGPSQAHLRDSQKRTVDHLEDRFRDLVRRERLNETGMRRLFRSVDRNRSGKISPSEFRKALRSMGIEARPDDVQELIGRFDIDGDGMIDYDEFIQFAVPSWERTHARRSESPGALRRRGRSRSPRRGDGSSLDYFRTIVIDSGVGKLAFERELESNDVGLIGRLTKSGLRDALGCLGIYVPQMHFSNVCERFDADGDALVDYRALARSVFYGTRKRGGNQPHIRHVDELEDEVREIIKRERHNSRSIESIFAEFDINGDGRVDRSEFRSILRDMGCAATSEEVYELVRRFDIDSDGRIDYGEFIGFLFPSRECAGDQSDAATSLKNLIRRTARLDTWALRRLFQKFDAGDCGYATRADFARVVPALGIEARGRELDDLFAAFGARDERVDYASFVRFGLRGEAPHARRSVYRGDPLRASVNLNAFGSIDATIRSILRRRSRFAGDGASLITLLSNAFARRDRRRDGRISHRQFEAVLADGGLDVSRNELKELCSRFTSSDGMVDYERFLDVAAGSQDEENRAVWRSKSRSRSPSRRAHFKYRNPRKYQDEQNPAERSRIYIRVLRNTNARSRVRGLLENHGIDENGLLRLFRVYDDDERFVVEAREAKQLLHTLGYHRGVEDIIDAFGKSRDGTFDYDAFVSFVFSEGDAGRGYPRMDSSGEMDADYDISDDPRDHPGDYEDALPLGEIDESELQAWEECTVTGIPPPAALRRSRRRRYPASRANSIRGTDLGRSRAIHADEGYIGDDANDELATHATLGDRIRSAFTLSNDALSMILFIAENCESKASADGTLTNNDFEKCVRDAFKSSLATEDIAEILSRFTHKEDGLVHYREFLDSAWHLVPAPARKGLDGWQDIFASRTRGGRRTINEMEDALRDEILSRKFDSFALRDLFREFDRNGDGRISVHEMSTSLRKMGFTSYKKREIDALIRRFDVDGDGRIDYEEFISIMVPSQERTFAEDYGQADTELGRLRKKNAVLERQLERETALLELEASGSAGVEKRKLRAAEAKLRAHLAQLADTGRSVSTGKIDLLRAFRAFDRNGDGSITTNEFSRALSSMKLLLDPEERELLVERFDRTKSGRVAYKGFVDFFLNPELNPRESLENSVLVEDRLRDDLRRQFAGKAWTGSKLRDAFADMDPDGHGSLTRSEFARAVESVSALPLDDAALDALFRILDTNGDGRVSYREFKSFATAPPASPKRGRAKQRADMRMIEDAVRKIVRSMANTDENGILDVKKAFRFFDLNATGCITTREFKSALKRLGFRLTQAELSELVGYFDKNNDGMIQWSEFLEFFKSTGSYVHDTEATKKLKRAQKAAEELERALRIKLKKLQVGPSMRRQFRRFDKNKTGSLSRSEFASMISSLGFRLSKWEEDWLMQKLDSDDSGLITYAEFSAFVHEGGSNRQDASGRKSALVKSILRKIKKLVGSKNLDMRSPFVKFDIDGNGFLDKDEFEYALRDLGVSLTDKELDAMFQFFDRDDNGKVEYGEFLFVFFNRRSLVKQWAKQARRYHPSGLTAGAGEEKAALLESMRRFDSDGSGLFSRQKLLRVVKQLGIMAPRWQIEAMVDKCAARGANMIQYATFADVLLEVKKREAIPSKRAPRPNGTFF